MRSCGSSHEALNWLRDQIADHPVDEEIFWDQVEAVVTKRDPRMNESIFKELVSFTFVSALIHLTDGVFIGRSVNSAKQERILRSLMNYWDPIKVDLEAVEPWILGPDIAAVVEDAILAGAGTAYGLWAECALTAGHDIVAACYAKKLSPADLLDLENSLSATLRTRLHVALGLRAAARAVLTTPAPTSTPSAGIYCPVALL
jgi:hypothetical protein